jgi:uncharacterized tellurite resistance protein B-like protein
MDELEYHRFLFNTAMLVMSCDGEIHDDEVTEMRLALKHSVMFKGLDFDSELDRFQSELAADAGSAIGNYFEKLETLGLDPVQKLQVLEIVLRIMYADDRADENEIRFLRLVKDRLGVMDEIFFKRFGDVDVLPIGVAPEENKSSSVTDFSYAFELPGDSEFEKATEAKKR